MKRTHVVLLLLILATIALLWAAGPDRVAEAVMRLIGKDEAGRRDELEADVRDALDGLRAELERDGIQTFIGSTLRTPKEQAEKVTAGSSTTATTSWHLLGRAVDLYPLDPATGQPDRNGKLWDTLFRRMHALAPGWGFRGLAFNPDGTRRMLKRADGSKFWDGGHLEHPGGYRSFAEAKAARDRRLAHA